MIPAKNRPHGSWILRLIICVNDQPLLLLKGKNNPIVLISSFVSVLFCSPCYLRFLFALVPTTANVAVPDITLDYRTLKP